nr:uncharacterized protein RP090-like [Nerophis lumbriciformis]
MRLDPDNFFGSLALSLVARLAGLWIGLLERTCRYRIVSGGKHLEALLAEPRPVIFCFWHNRLLLAAPYLFHRVHRRGLEITVLASQSRDGELAARLAGVWRLRTVRGSATRGGRQAMRGIYRAIARHRSSPIMIPDGPTGPIYKFKPGVAVLAQMSDVPILPLGLAARRRLRVGSWDRLMVPWPFSRVAIAVGAPRPVPRGLSSEEFAAAVRDLETILDDLTLTCEGEVDSPDEHRPATDDLSR